MKLDPLSRRLPLAMAVSALVVAMFVLMAVQDSQAQVPAAAARSPLLRTLQIRQFNGLGRRQRVRPPVGRSASRANEWYEMRTLYDYAGEEWVDELAFRYNLILSLPGERGEGPRYSLFSLTVAYADIQQGRGRKSTVFLRPAALLRFGEPVAASVEILHEGQVVAEASEESIPFPEGEKWYRNPAVIESRAVTRRHGYLLNRADTPWALIEFDEYEHIKP